MKKSSRTVWWALAIVTLVGLVFFALVHTMPSLQRISDTDSSIFQYFGQRMREGQLPYRDVYDHKPPLVFYLNEWGLSLGNGSRWGIWAVELVSLSAAALIGFAALSPIFGLYPAWLAIAGFLTNLIFVHEGGNLTEEYAMPLQFAALLLLVAAERRQKGGWRVLLIGVCLGMASSLKQPLAGPLVAVGLILLISRLRRRDWRGLWDLIWLGLGFGLVWAAWFAWFAAHGALPEFWEAAFAYNFALSGITTNQRLDALIEGVYFLLSRSPFYAASFAAWVAAAAFLVLNDQRLGRALTSRWMGLGGAALGLLLLYNGLFHSGLKMVALNALSPYRLAQAALGLLALGLGLAWIFRRWDHTARAWYQRVRQGATTPWAVALAFGLIDLPVEIMLSSLSGNNFRHYYMALMPSICVLQAFLPGWLLSLSGAFRRMAWVWAAAVVLPLVISGAFSTYDQISIDEDQALSEMIQYVEDHTQPSDRVLQWGDLPMINTVSGRLAPSRYFFIDPLFLPNYTSHYHTDAFLADLKANPPALIVDTQPRFQPLFYEYDAQNCNLLLDPKYLAERVAKIQPSVPGHSITDYRDKYFQPPQIAPGMPEVYQWICANYDEETSLGDWVILRYDPNRP